jgi:hypothetical protein
MTEWNTDELVAADSPSLKLRRGFGHGELMQKRGAHD